MNKTTNYIINAINKTDRRIIIFITLLIYVLRFKVSGNGEQYLPYAKQFADPDWMPYSFWYNDFAGTRLAFQVLFGWILKYMSMEWFTLMANIATAILFTPVLNRIFKYFKISPFQTLFWLQAIWLGNQALYAGGWMIKSIETKVFAYYFILYAFNKALDKKYIQSTLFLALSMYFHILVGFWYSSLIFIWFITRGVKLKSVIGYGVMFSVLVIPLLLYLSSGLFGGETLINGVNTDWIYVYVRNPHHLAIFKSYERFMALFIHGIIITLIFYYFCFRFLKTQTDEKVRDLSKLIIILISQQIIFIIVGIFDKNGAILKTYPYRTSVLTMLLMLINFQRVFNLNENNKLSYMYGKYLPYIRIFCLVWISYNTFYAYTIKNYRTHIFHPYTKDIMEIAEYAKKNTDTLDVFLFPKKDNNFLYFSRFAERDRFYMQKNIPSEKRKIYEWYRRHLAWEDMANDVSKLEKYKDEFRIDYMVYPAKLEYPWLELVNKTGDFYLYKVK